MTKSKAALAPPPAEMPVTEQVAFLNSVLESSTEYSIVAKDLDGTILAWNEGARRIYGYEPADIMGRSAFILHDPADVKNGLAQQILRGAEDGQVVGRDPPGAQGRQPVPGIRDHYAAA